MTKTKTTHAPGEWRELDMPIRDGFIRSGNKIIAAINERHTPEGEANARLIAAAPELLTQLKAWIAWAETLPGGIEQFEAFARKQNNWADAPVPEHTRAAIAKVEGK